MARQGYKVSTFTGPEADLLAFIAKQENARSIPETVRRLTNLYFRIYPEKRVEYESSGAAGADLQETARNGLYGILSLDLSFLQPLRKVAPTAF